MRQQIPLADARQPRREALIHCLSARPSSLGRRAGPRFAVELDVTLSSEHNFYSGFAENLSEGGIFVATHLVKPIGSSVALSISLPELSQTISVLGVVRWVREYNEESNVPPGMGIQFANLPHESRAAIAAFLSLREPLFFEE